MSDSLDYQGDTGSFWLWTGRALFVIAVLISVALIWTMIRRLNQE